jgi:Bacterial PH domain/Short C-terminal domain
LVSDKKDGAFLTDITDGNELDEINRVANMLNPGERVLLVARQSRILPGGSALTPNVVIATDRRIIIRNPFMLGLKAEVVDIPYDVITSVKLQKGVFTSAILFRAPALVNPSKLGLLDENVGGEDDQDGIIEAVPKDKAEDLLELIRRGMKSVGKIDDSSGQIDSISVADEIAKLSKLKDQGIITGSEFDQMKKQLIDKN